MAELDSLSDKELRQKCVEYGLPNVPVTSTSRKLLIKRLEAAISGKPIVSTPSKTSRRDTVHVSKPSEVASSPKITAYNNKPLKQATINNRPSRRTIAVPERQFATTTTVSEPEYSDVSPDRVESEPVRAKTKTPEKTQTLYPKLPEKEPSPKPQQLSKTGVVTTSYVQETTSDKNSYVAPEEIHLDDDFVEKPFNNPSILSYKPLSEAKASTTSTLPATLSSSTRYSSLDSYNYNKPNYTSTGLARASYMPSSFAYNKSSESPRPTQVYDVEMEDDDDYEDEEDEVVLVEESPIKEVDTPFLSQFARNLENLKATPLRQSLGPTKIIPPTSTIRNRDVYSRRTVGTPFVNVNRRRTINPTNECGDFSFRQFILAMEEKYHLKHSLLLISIFIVAIFIYVFFIQTV